MTARPRGSIAPTGSGSWRVSVSHDGERLGGTFATYEEADAARLAMCRRLGVDPGGRCDVRLRDYCLTPVRKPTAIQQKKSPAEAGP